MTHCKLFEIALYKFTKHGIEKRFKKEICLFEGRDERPQKLQFSIECYIKCELNRKFRFENIFQILKKESKKKEQ